ncbi:MAG: hypothetical protein ACYCVL_10905 [Gemmatimonadaceae bacterium]
MKASLSAVLLVTAGACFGAHIVTSSAPLPPAPTFACATRTVISLGYTITTSNPASGFLDAEKRDLGSPDSAEYSELAVSVYADADGKTRIMVTPGRTRLNGPGPRTTDGVFTMGPDQQAADSVVKVCSKG